MERALSQLLHDKRRLLQFAGATAVLLFGVLLMVLVFQPRYTRMTLTDTRLVYGRNFGMLEGTTLLGYNGLAFFSLDTSRPNAKPRVLYSGAKLPVPKTVYWAGTKGALVEFGASFAGSQIETIIAPSNRTLSIAQKSYAWYINFADGSLTRATDGPLLASGAQFSRAQNGFFYLPDQPAANQASARQLYFFDITSKQGSLVADNIAMLNVSRLTDCQTTGSDICLVGQMNKKPYPWKVVGFSRSGAKSELATSPNRIITTNDPLVYITAKASRTIPLDSDNQEDTEVPRTDARVYNVATKKMRDLPFKIGSEPVMVSVLPNDEYFILDREAVTTPGVYLAGFTSRAKAKQLPLQFTDSRRYSGTFANIVSYGSGGRMLISTTTGAQLLMAPQAIIQPITSAPVKSADTAVKDCSSQAGGSYDYFSDTKLFKVYFTDRGSVGSSIAAFNRCLIERQSEVLVGYNFYFGTLDSVNGRITSD